MALWIMSMLCLSHRARRCATAFGVAAAMCASHPRAEQVSLDDKKASRSAAVAYFLAFSAVGFDLHSSQKRALLLVRFLHDLVRHAYPADARYSSRFAF